MRCAHRSATVLAAGWLALAGCAGSTSATKGTEELGQRPSFESDGGAQTSAVEPPAATAKGKADLAGDAGTSVSGNGSSNAASSSEDAGAPPPMKVVDVCGKWCERMRAQGCAETAVQECRTNCARYRPPASCDAEGRAAFECARSAPDVQCAYIAPTSCNSKFQRMMACAHGEQVNLPPDKPDLPEGWERYRAKTARFHVPMPRNVVEKTTEGRPTFASEQGPATYSIQIYPPLTEPPTQKNLVLLAMRLLGNDCSGRKLRIHGVVEQNGQTSVRYDTECRNGPELHGLFHIAPNAFYLLTISSPRGFKAERDPFLYGFALE